MRTVDHGKATTHAQSSAATARSSCIESIDDDVDLCSETTDVLSGVTWGISSLHLHTSGTTTNWTTVLTNLHSYSTIYYSSLHHIMIMTCESSLLIGHSFFVDNIIMESYTCSETPLYSGH